MNKIKKALLLALSLVMSATLFAACGKDKGGSTSSSESSSVESSVPVDSSEEDSSVEDSSSVEESSNEVSSEEESSDEVSSEEESSEEPELPDTTKPVLSTIDETQFADLKVGDKITIPTVTATDDKDGDVTVYVSFGTMMFQNPVQMGEEITFEFAGNYVLKYTAQDEAGNVAEKTINVTVVCDHEYIIENKDDANHWLECECGDINEESVTTHEFNVKSDDDNHWQECECGAKKDEETHSYGELSDGEQGMAYYCACGDYMTNEDLVDFVVPIESGKDPVVLQLSDTQTWWWGDTAENQCYRYVREVVEETNPDLIILTGDIVYGRFDPEGNLLVSLINFMETLNIPWAPVFGNHDNESLMGVDWQCAQLETAENCLFKQGDLTGNGNYSVGLEQDGELLRVFYMMDSNGCTKPMCDSNGVQTTPAAGTNIVKTTQGFGQDQIDWYTEEINAIHAVDADVKISMAYHIQQAIFEKAFQKYDEYDGLTTDSALNNPLNLDTMETADETDFGYLGRPMKGGWDYNYSIFNGMKALGVDSIFVGHEHCNSASIVYEGVRFQYGQKSSTYDRYNYVTEDGTITGGTSTPAGAHALLGGTVIPVSGEDGSIGTGYICYYGDPFYFEPEPEPVIVEGLQYGTDLTVQSDKNSANGTFQAVAYDENTNAYYIESGTSYNRLYINVDLLRGKSTVSFDILVPEEATKADGTATQEFAIRVKPNESTANLPNGDSTGYYWFDASFTDARKVIIGEWQTITIDISSFADVCTEFGIYFVEGNNGAYIKNVAVGETAIDEGTGSETPEEVVVNGLEISADDLQAGKTMSLEALAFDETVNAYKITSGSDSAKLFFDTALAIANNVFTFSVYIPEDSPIATSQEFLLRVKPNDTLTEEQGSSDGKYIYYSSTTDNALRKVNRGEWTTVSVDISNVGEDCTEFAFMFATGTEIWIKDIVFA
ncbi:MAG: metallophosphoesterase [Clostridia bacterium]|nr:metallophosphoesterase [Clostridia bacterium]